MTPQSIEALVDRQMRRWGSRLEAEKEAASKTGAVSLAPCIALSREPHSGGGDLARRLAERLDYGLFGREILDEIEKQQGIQRELMESLDERLRGKVDRYVVDVFRGKTFKESDYLVHLVKALRVVGERGLAVMLGRGAQYVLRPDRTLRVLAVAPFEVRAGRLAEEQGLERLAAEEQLRREDRERDDFLRVHFQHEHTDARHYDLCLNLGTLAMDTAVGMALTALGDRFPHARVE